MMSIRPNSSTAFSTSWSGMPRCVRSPAKTVVSPAISDAACSATSPSRSLINTRAPWSASSSAVARPIPRADPVTIAALPSSTPTLGLLLGLPTCALRARFNCFTNPVASLAARISNYLRTPGIMTIRRRGGAGWPRSSGRARARGSRAGPRARRGIRPPCCGEPADRPHHRRTPRLCAPCHRNGGPAARVNLVMAHDRTALRVLFLVSAHNSLSQRAYIALTELGHEVAVMVVESATAMEAAVARHRPDLIVCPMLKKLIPESIWASHRCLIVHPGPRGDRGPSSLDWAIELGMDEWGVTLLEATGDVDGGDIWATRNFAMRETGKSSIYRPEVRRAAIASLLDAMAALEDP